MLAKRSATTALNHHFMKDTTLAACLAALPGAASARREARGWSLTTASLQTALPALVRLADDGGWDFRSLTTRSATLEDVFVSLTGRHLRDV